jgi:predicted PurR-regulated permease PerM
MLGFDRRAAKITWTVALVAVALLAVYSIRKTLFIFLLAVFFSYMVYPAVKRLMQYTPKRFSYSAATATVFAVIVLLVVGFVALIGPPIADQASSLGDKLPALVKDPHALDRIPLPDWLTPYRGRATSFIQEQFASGASVALPIAKQVGQVALVVASNLIYVILIPILAFLMIKDATPMRDGFLAWVRGEGRHGGMWTKIVDGLDVLLGRYIRSLLILSGATLTIYSIVFSIAGVPYALLLAALAAVLEFIPVIGPLGAAVVCLVVSGLSGYDHLVLLLGFIVVYRLFQDYVLNPYLMSDGVEVPPLLVLFGLLAGEEIGGVVGIFLSVPALAAAKIVTQSIFAEVKGRRTQPQVSSQAPALVVEPKKEIALESK